MRDKLNALHCILCKYDAEVLAGFKTLLTIAWLTGCIYFLDQGKLQYFVSALGLVHLFALRIAKNDSTS